VVVLIDEAQAMQPDSLEEIKLLSNLETAQRKLMQIVLFGQPELQELLAQPRLRQVRDRVVHRFELQPLSDVESVAYIDHRLRRAGWRGARLFDARALKMLVSAGAGRMRAIHLLADKALLAAYADGAYEVLPAHVKRAQADLLLVGHVSSSGRPASGWARLPAPVAWALLAVSLALVVGMGLGWVLGQFQAPTPKSAQATKPPVVAEVVALAPSPAPAVETQPEATAPTTPPAAAPALPAATTPTPAPTAPAGPATATAPDPQRYEGLPSHLRQHVEHSRAVLDDPQLQGWTLQIGIAKDVAALKHLWSQVKDLSPLWLHDRYYSRTHPLTGHTGLGAVWAVYVGRYASRAEAQEALRALPAALQTYKPMVRTFGGIRSEPYPERPPL
jgi:septal ring-binding cell division protein DamX